MTRSAGHHFSIGKIWAFPGATLETKDILWMGFILRILTKVEHDRKRGFVVITFLGKIGGQYSWRRLTMIRPYFFAVFSDVRTCKARKKVPITNCQWPWTSCYNLLQSFAVIILQHLHWVLMSTTNVYSRVRSLFSSTAVYSNRNLKAD